MSSLLCAHLCVCVYIQACLASPVIDLLKEHNQSLDPNLVQLADTWREAEARLPPEQLAEAARRLAAADARDAPAAAAGDDGAESGDDDEGDAAHVSDHGRETDADAMLEAEDLGEGLRGASRDGLGLKAAGKAAKKQRRDTAPTAVTDKGDVPAPASFQARLQRAEAAGAATAAGKAQLAQASKPSIPFVAAKKFQGARAGYVFKLGPQGVGYYVDTPPRKLSKANLQQLTARGKGPIVPIGPQSGKKRSDRSRFDSSSEDESDRSDAGGSSSDDERDQAVAGKGAAGLQNGAVGGRVQAGEKKKPLGGRLRKKLAKQRAAAGGGGAQ